MKTIVILQQLTVVKITHHGIFNTDTVAGYELKM
jgi:hypothetical protein